MAENQEEVLFEFDLGELGDHLRFSSAEEIVKWVDEEEKYWQWLSGALGSHGSAVWAQQCRPYKPIRDHANRLQPNLDPKLQEKTLQHIETQFKTYFSTGQTLASSNPAAKFIARLKEQDEKKAAAACCALIGADLSNLLRGSLGSALELTVSALVGQGQPPSTLGAASRRSQPALESQCAMAEPCPHLSQAIHQALSVISRADNHLEV